jgi:succinoglycan biosynthesis protein ExoA
MADIEVSVVIPVRNERTRLADCLTALVQQDYPADRMEILVVDGRSDDGTRGVIKEFCMRHKHVRLLKNYKRTTAHGLNIGINEARGRIIVRVDGDVVVEPDCITQAVRALDETGADTVAGVVLPRAESTFHRAMIGAICSAFSWGISSLRFRRPRRFVDSVPCGAYRREVFETIGLFDDDLKKYHSDEFSCRLRCVGGTITVDPKVRAHHVFRSNLAKLWERTVYDGMWRIRLFQKHFTFRYWRQLVPMLLVFSAIVALATTILGIFLHVHPLVTIRAVSLALVGLYLVLAVYFSVQAHIVNHLKPNLWVPLTFLTYHTAFGWGMLCGVFRFIGRRGARRHHVPRITARR